MPREIRPLTEQDIDAAARLLVARHRADRERTPALSSRFEDPEEAAGQIRAGLDGPLASGVIATENAEPVGFLTGAVSIPTEWYSGFLPRRSAAIPYAGHTASGSDAQETYREMYAALAPFFVRYGAFTHNIEINAGDEVAREAWFSLGFGRESMLTVKETAGSDPTESSSNDVVIRMAGKDDIDALVELADTLGRHHNTSPIFLPYLPEETNPGFRTYQAELLEKPQTAHWVAYRGGQPVAMQTFHEQDFAEMARPEKAIYLFIGVTTPEVRGGGVGKAILKQAMGWAAKEGYERCTLHFLSANISAARFWLRSGFQPLTQGLVRRLDERVAWANVENER